MNTGDTTRTMTHGAFFDEVFDATFHATDGMSHYTTVGPTHGATLGVTYDATVTLTRGTLSRAEPPAPEGVVA